ncbi:MAG TPA: DUF934 domain-containing protein [Methylomirabilota bacterium]|nr:DUF934 domain-containing protein [Methylomirabilota bacterium]
MTIQTPLAPTVTAPPVPHDDVYRDGRFQPDDWARLADDAPLPPEGRVLLSVRRFLDDMAAGAIGNRPVGVIVAPADRVGDLVPHLDRLAVIAVDFPKFSDGRGFSHAALIARHGFSGELRAVGNVLIDQVTFMQRLGFVSFEVRHAVSRRYLSEGRNPSPKHYYQPAVISEPPVGTRPWLRRAKDR